MAAALAWAVGALGAAALAWAVGASAAVEFEWQARVSVVVPSVLAALVSGEVRESIAGSVPGFELPVYVAVMLAVLSVLDGQAFAKADFTANAMATDGAEGGGASQLRRPPLASVTMPGGMVMTTAASLGTATSG